MTGRQDIREANRIQHHMTEPEVAMKRFLESAAQSLVAGVLLVAPLYLAALLLLKSMKSLAGLVRPVARLLPKSFPAETITSLLLVLILCLMVGMLLRTTLGKITQAKLENSLLQKIPGYEVFRGMTKQLAGGSQETEWKPALVEIEDALVPAFIVEELEDGRFTVFVPSVPTPLAGAVYILSAERVYPLNVPFAQAVKVVTRWGSGSHALVNSMQIKRMRPTA